MEETTTMGGRAAETDKKQLDVLVIEEKVMVPVATLDVSMLAMENPVALDDMFEDIADTEQYDVLALARTSPNLSTFVKLIEQANLVNDLKRVEEVTLLAPTNEAFAKMPKEKLMTLLSAENIALLSTMLQAHVLPADVSSMQLKENSRIRLTETSFIPIDAGVAGTNIRIGNAQVIKSDIEASNGRIHIIDNVLQARQ